MGRFYGDAEHPERIAELNALFVAQFRIQREACEAAGRYIPMIVENVRGAQWWVGKAAANYGSFYLWGDVGMVGNRVVCVVDGQILGGAGVRPMKASKVPGFRFDGSGGSFQTAAVKATKNDGESWFNVAHNTASGKGNNPCRARKSTEESCKRLPGARGGRISGWPHVDQSDGTKFSQSGDAWFDGKPRDKMLCDKGPAAYGSKSTQRKMASAMIAKIPFPLSQHIARTFKPQESK